MSVGKYATDTSVSVEQSKAEIEKVLIKYGACRFGYLTEPNYATILFEIENRKIKMVLPLPSKTARVFTHTPMHKMRTPEAALGAWEQACRSRWRALFLVVKARLEAVECGISTIEQEFLAHVVLPGGETVYERSKEQIATAYLEGASVPFLLEAKNDNNK